MSRMIFAPWSKAGSYPAWESPDFHFSITGLTVGNSFLPMGRGNGENCSEEADVTPTPSTAQELRLPLLLWMFRLTQVFQALPPHSAPPALETCTASTRITPPSTSWGVGPICSHCLLIFCPRGIKVSTADLRGKMWSISQPGRQYIYNVKERSSSYLI